MLAVGYGTRMSKGTPVAKLWDKLAEMELAEEAGCGKMYPDGRCKFPFRLRGQGFFPGGDGLWRTLDGLAASSSGVIPEDSIMCVGNDFGKKSDFDGYEFVYFENTTTVKNFRKRIELADLPRNLVFATNAVMGLKTADKALAKTKVWSQPDFVHFNKTFLLFQIETIKPRLVVFMGDDVAQRFANLIRTAVVPEHLPFMGRANFGTHRTAYHYTTHPYGDFNFDDTRKRTDSDALRRAWEFSVTTE